MTRRSRPENVKVREALNIAIDRARINDSFFKGDAIPSAVSHMAEWWDFFQDRWAPLPGPDGNTGAAGGWPYPYDPERAKELLAEAGYPDGFTLEFFASTNLGGLPEIPDVGEAIAFMWEEIGIDVKLEIGEYAPVQAMYSDRAMNGKVAMIRWSLNPPSAGMGWLWYEATRPYYEYQFITDWKRNVDTIADPEIRVAGVHQARGLLVRQLPKHSVAVGVRQGRLQPHGAGRLRG